MYSGVSHLGKDDDKMGTNIIEPGAQPVLGEVEHQPVLGEVEPQLVAEEQHEPNKDQPKRVSVAPKTWQEAAAAAGVVTMVREDEVVINPSKKKKTPLEYRMQKPRIKESAKPLNMAEKKLFKEAFNTDKFRLFTPNMERSGIS